jgi:hypothetical protein
LTFHRDGLIYSKIMWVKSDLRGEKSRFSCRHVVVLLAILAISLSVATRTFHGFSFDHPSVQSNASQAMRQHLAADAVVLTNPVSDLGAMLLPMAAPHAPPDEVPVHTLVFTESLYNRPPPSISLL